jgi:hypothetical protein
MKHIYFYKASAHYFVLLQFYFCTATVISVFVSTHKILFVIVLLFDFYHDRFCLFIVKYCHLQKDECLFLFTYTHTFASSLSSSVQDQRFYI